MHHYTITLPHQNKRHTISTPHSDDDPLPGGRKREDYPIGLDHAAHITEFNDCITVHLTHQSKLSSTERREQLCCRTLLSHGRKVERFSQEAMQYAAALKGWIQ
jgi:hypothetical protein